MAADLLPDQRQRITELTTELDVTRQKLQHLHDHNHNALLAVLQNAGEIIEKEQLDLLKDGLEQTKAAIKVQTNVLSRAGVAAAAHVKDFRRYQGTRRDQLGA